MEVINIKAKDLYLIDKKLKGIGDLGFYSSDLSGKDLIVSEYGVKALSRNSYLGFLSMLKKVSLNVNLGYYVELEFEGLGYRFINLKDELILRIGYGHYVYFRIPENVLVFGFRKHLLMFSLSKQLLYQLVYIVSSLKRYNCYKKKGIFLKGQVVRMKEIKSSSK